MLISTTYIFDEFTGGRKSGRLYEIQHANRTGPRRTDSEGGFIDPNNFYNRGFLSALRRSKIRKVTFHALRHSNVSLRLDQGQPILYISRQIGHSSVKTTLDIYGHLMKDVHSEQAKKLDDILGFVEHSGNSSEAVRRLLEEGNKKGVAVYATP